MENSTYYETIDCNLCNSKEFKIKYKPKVKDFDPTKIFSASGGIMGTQQIVTCSNCGLIYVNPRIKPEMVINAYTESVDELYVSQEEGRKRTFAKALKFVNKYAQNKGKILDVGAAAGFFLDLAKIDGWFTTGVEPCSWMSEWGNKKFDVNIKNTTLQNAKFENEQFDVITMWDVLEHTPDPMSELREANRILKREGVLIINFPNIGSKLAKLAGSRWWFILSVHLFHFDHKTMRKYLEKNGFKIISFKRHYQTLSFEHLMKMVGLYSKFISKIGLSMIKFLHMNNWQIPYYASQSNVIAKKL